MKRMITTFYVLFFLFLFISPVYSNGQQVNKNPLEGFDEFVEKQMKEWNVPGIAIAVIKDGNVILSKGYGYRNAEKQLEVTPNTLFAIGSATKAFTVMSMGLLVDEGKLNWDKPVRTYLPEFKMYDLFASVRMTPRDLVTHRSGLPRHDAMWYNSSLSRKELFNRLQYLKPNEDFRAVFQYQNLMFMTAGYLVGQISGGTWEQFVQDKIFNPLGMKNSNFSVEESRKTEDFAFPYTKDDDTVKKIPFRNIDTIGPAGSINSNINEMAQWVLLHLNKGKHNGTQFISEKTITEMHTPQMVIKSPVQYNEIPLSNYGMGWFIQPYRGHYKLHHGGNIDGFSALVTFMPQDSIGTVILTNLNGTPLPSIIAYNIEDRLLGLNQILWSQRMKKSIEEREKKRKEEDKKEDEYRKQNTTTSHPLEHYEGTYDHPGYGIFTITNENGNLKACYNDITYILEHYHYDVFIAKSEETGEESYKILFRMNKKGEISEVAVPLERNVNDIIFKRQIEEE